MALGNVLGDIAGSAASALASAAFNKAFGGDSPKLKAGSGVIRNIAGTGFSSRASDGALSFTRNPATQQLFNLFNARAGQTGNELSALQGQIAPGFGRLTDSTRQVFANARQRLTDAQRASTSDLRGNLERRRVLGSSFANDALGRRESEFARVEDELVAAENEALAKSFLAELDLTTQNILQRSEIDLGAILQNINQLNLEGEFAVNIANGTQQVMAENAQLQARLAALNAQGLGAFFQPAIDSIGEEVSGLFQ